MIPRTTSSASRVYRIRELTSAAHGSGICTFKWLGGNGSEHQVQGQERMKSDARTVSQEYKSAALIQISQGWYIQEAQHGSPPQKIMNENWEPPPVSRVVVKCPSAPWRPWRRSSSQLRTNGPSLLSPLCCSKMSIRFCDACVSMVVSMACRWPALVSLPVFPQCTHSYPQQRHARMQPFPVL